MNDPFIMDCNGIFYDDGVGETAYQDTLTQTTTICSSGNGGTHVRLSFSSFQLAFGDSLLFYDGTTAHPDSLLGDINDFVDSLATSVQGTAFIIQATAANPSGCLTMVFKPNDDGNVGVGWEALLSCSVACQNIFVDLDATDPTVMPADTGFIDICPGQEISLSATGRFPQSGILYQQSDAMSTFEWTMDDGNVVSGQSINYTYTEPGGYVVQLALIDQNGCRNLNLITQRVRVAPPPRFNTNIQYPICFGDTVSLTASNQGGSGADVLIQSGTTGFPIGGIRADSLPLPDGVLSYKTSIMIEDFPDGKLLENPNDLESICMNIEHSYLFDLDIILTCPNGQSDTLQQTSFLSGQVSTLGVPFEADDGQNTGINGHIPGLGFDYCFTADGDFQWNEYINANGAGQLPSGDYLPVQRFTELVGCPLNGTWTLEVADRLPQDNGWIFEWSINFAKRILPFSRSFSPAIVDYAWVNNPEIDFYTADSIATYGSSAGDVNYVLRAIDEFGCSWDTSVVVTVLPLTHPDCYECSLLLNRENDVLICNPESRQLNVTSNELVLETAVDYIATPNVPVGFENNPPATPLLSSITVGNVVPDVLTNPASQLISICVDLETDEVGDIALTLRAPSGQTLELSTHNGGNSAGGYSQVCFTPTATNPIDLAFPPYSGNYLPEGNFSSLNGASIDGDWVLSVSDDSDINETGVLKSWSISFQSTNQVTYSWSPGFGLSCDDCPNPMAAPNATTNYIVMARDLFGCTDRDTIVVAIASDLPEPVLECSTTANGEITFTWQKVENFSLFDVRLTRNGVTGPWEGPITDLSYVVTGLQLLDSVSLDLRVFADPNSPSCDNPEVRSSCVYTACVHEGMIDEVTPVTCSELSDGTVSIMGVNGAAPYLYFLDGSSTGQNSGIFTNLTAGDHTIIIQDQTGCQDTTMFEVPTPLPLVLNIEQEKAVSCRDGSDGILRGMVSGGNGGYHYNWIGLNRPDTSTINNLAPGTYELQVTDRNGCVINASFTLNNPAGIQLELLPIASSCSDSQDGSVETLISGGTPSYTFRWDNGATVAEPVNFLPGTHCLTVTDGRGCIETACVSTTAPPPLVVDSLSSVPAQCFDTNTGMATVFVSGGNGNYAYSWSDGLQQISQQAVRLRAGSYSVAVTDQMGCQVSGNIVVTQPDPLTLNVTADNAKCFGSADGVARVAVSGGVAPFSYEWSGGGTQAQETGLPMGTYEVTVTDIKGCIATDEAIIAQPATAVSVLATQTHQACAGASDNEVEAIAMGGTNSGFTYTWNDPGQQTGPNADGLVANTYIVTAMDGNGCVGRDTIAVMDLPEITIGVIANSPSCPEISDGRMGVNQIMGGIGGDNPGNYTFRWSTGASGLTINGLPGNRDYSVTATDNRGCIGVQTRFLPDPDTIAFDFTVTDVSCNNGTDGTATVINVTGAGNRFMVTWGAATGGQTGVTARGLRAGNYNVTVSDDRGCSNTNAIKINEPPPINLRFQTQDISCYGGNEGSITVTASGGKPDYTYRWSNGLPTNPTVTNLQAGTYQLTVTDANNCSTQSNATILQPATVEVNIDITDVTCFGDRDGRIEVNTIGGTPPYQYSLDNINYNGIATMIGLTASNQTVYVRDAKGCLYVQPVTIGTPPEFLLDLGPDLTIRLGDTVSLIANLIDPAGGTADLFWSAPYEGTMSCEQCPSPDIYPQNTIYYSVLGYDSNGCEAEDQIRVVVEKPRVVLVPTGFTPNGDAKNDQLIVHGLEGTTIKVFRIFDRWGELMYERSDFPVNDPAFGWDGTFRGQDANSGVYIWYLEAIYPFDQQQESFKGQTTLIR